MITAKSGYLHKFTTMSAWNPKNNLFRENLRIWYLECHRHLNIFLDDHISFKYVFYIYHFNWHIYSCPLTDSNPHDVAIFIIHVFICLPTEYKKTTLSYFLFVEFSTLVAIYVICLKLILREKWNGQTWCEKLRFFELRYTSGPPSMWSRSFLCIRIQYRWLNAHGKWWWLPLTLYIGHHT